MAFELHHDNAFPGLAASAIQDRQVVYLIPGSSERAVAPCTVASARPHGVALASAIVGQAVTVHDRGNYVKCVAAASLGNGGEVGVVGATKSLGPLTAASGSVSCSAGQAVTAAAAGEVFTLYVNPRQLGGLA